MVEITVLGGVAGGLLATLVMTMLMMALGDDSPPPTAAFWSKYVGDGAPTDYMMQGMVLHFLYGLGAGVALAVVLPLVGFETVTLVTAVGVGLAYGFVLFAFAAVFWMKIVLAMDPEPPQVAQFLLFHLVYGAVLGGVIGAGIV
ncbi:hypothetical protein ACFQJ7_01975 [Halovenus rubra]|uniref:Uncharacterized protein n=2 Tax=Halovenus rubra TaxID=869890 RepID=A0ACC7E3D2_9EURY|nr:hypothetical protein [Halovenus rubra]